MRIREHKIVISMGAAGIGAIVASWWMRMAAAAITAGISFTTLWNLAAYISCPVIKLFGLSFWPVVMGNAVFYFASTWILQAVIGRKRKRGYDLAV
jgi:hypothetical protein